MQQKKRSGFTLVEIMVVVVIIGMLSALVVPRVISHQKQAKITATRTQMESYSQALDLFHLDNGFYPTTDQGLAALVEKPSAPPVPKKYRQGGYVKDINPDSWGNPYLYRCPGEHGDFDLFSYGPDGKEGGQGDDADINNWKSE